jgi:hypothetical protein
MTKVVVQAVSRLSLVLANISLPYSRPSVESRDCKIPIESDGFNLYLPSQFSRQFSRL